MRLKAVVTLCLAAIVVPAWAQTARPTDADKPYEGTVTGTNVYVRSGPGGPGAYPCAKLSAPAKVTVVGKMPDWLKILPPKGCYSVINKTYVKVDATTKIGTVTGDNVWVRAAGVLRDTGFWTLQLRLSTGDKVRVIGQAGEYYKIVSPKGAYFWISQQYVRRAGAVVVPRTRPVSTAPTTRPTTVPTVVPTKHTPVEVSAALKEFAAIEKLLMAEYKKPLEQRDFAALLTKYGAIKITPDSDFLKPYVAARIALLQASIENRKDMLAVNKIVRSVADREEKFRLDKAAVVAQTPTTRPVTAYAAQGVLLPSDVFPGGPAAPKRYIVRDRHTFFINAYVQCTTGAVDLDPFVGKHVGVMGTTRFYKDLGLDVVEAKEVIVLAEDVVFPMPPKPTVKPMPKPVVKPTVKPTIKPMPIIPLPLRPKPVVTTRPAPKVGPIIQPIPLVRPKPTPATKPATRPAPTTRPKPTPATKPAPSVVRPIIIKPTTKPAPTTKPVTKPTTRPTTAPIVEEEYD